MLRPVVAILFIVSIFIVVPSLHRPFFSRGEPREALVAAGMLSTGDWISPPAYDNLVPSKPPFTHWLMATLSLPAGEVTEVTARLPSALAMISFVTFFVAFVGKRLTPVLGMFSGLILLSSPEWFRAATSCRVDTMLACSMAGGLLALFSWYEGGRQRIPWLAILLLTAATLTKGPVGFCLPGAIFGLFLLIKGEVGISDLGRLFRNVAVVLLPVLALSSTWYVLGYLERGDEFLDKVWFENIQRLSRTADDEPHTHGLVYLWGLTGVGLLPWSLALLALVPAMYSYLRGTSSFNRQSVVTNFRESPAFLQFSVLAAVVTLAFFSIPEGKRSVYILPAYPFMSVLLAAALLRLEAYLRIPQILLRAACMVLLVVSFLFPVSLLIASHRFFLPLLEGNQRIGQMVTGAAVGYSDLVWILEVLFVAVVGAIVVLRMGSGSIREVLAQVNKKGNVVGTALLVVITVGVLNAFPMNAIAPALSIKNWLSRADLSTGIPLESNTTGYSFGSESYDASFYLHLPFRRIEVVGCPERGLLIIQSRHLDEYTQLCGHNFHPLSSFIPLGQSKSRSIVAARID